MFQRPTLEESKQEGYQSGYTWYERFRSFPYYLPGGPYVGLDRITMRANIQDTENNKAWRLEWIRGMKAYADEHSLIEPDFIKAEVSLSR